MIDHRFEYLKQKLGIIKKPEINLPVIPLGIHPEYFQQIPNEKKEIRQQLEIESNDFVILYYGTLKVIERALQKWLIFFPL